MRRGLYGCAVDEEAAGHALDFGRGDEPGRRVGSDIRAGVVSGTAKARRPPSAGLGAGWRQLTRPEGLPDERTEPGHLTAEAGAGAEDGGRAVDGDSGSGEAAGGRRDGQRGQVPGLAVGAERPPLG